MKLIKNDWRKKFNELNNKLEIDECETIEQDVTVDDFVKQYLYVIMHDHGDGAMIDNFLMDNKDFIEELKAASESFYDHEYLEKLRYENSFNSGIAIQLYADELQELTGHDYEWIRKIIYNCYWVRLMWDAIVGGMYKPEEV